MAEEETRAPAEADPGEPKPRQRVVWPSPVEWLTLPAGVYLIFHYFWFMDDAYVYYRYADNAIFLGYGLVYNAGEYAEGYSSPLWMLLMVALRALRLNWWAITGAMAILGYVAFWAQMVILNRRLSPRSDFIVNFPLVFLTFCYAASSFFTSGLETPLVLAIAVTYALFIVTPGYAVLEVLVGISPLIRQELVIPLALAAAWSFYVRRRVPWRLLLTAIATGGAWMIFRIWYYADLFPTTYYLKNEFAPVQGLAYLHDTLLPYHGYTLAAIFGLTLAVLWRRSEFRHRLRLPQRSFMLLTAASAAAYTVKIGGDALHFRLLIFPFVLAVCAAAGLIEELLVRVMSLEHVKRLTVKPARLLEGVLLGLLGVAGFVLAYVWELRVLLAPTAACLIGSIMLAGPLGARPMSIAIASIIALLAFVSFPRQLQYHPFGLNEMTGYVDYIGDVAGYRMLPGLDPQEQIDDYEEFEELGGRYPPKVITADWCALNYRWFYLRIVHSLGLTDPVLARVEIHSPMPGHKWGLRSMADDLAEIYTLFGIGEGVFGRAVQAGVAPPWVEANLDNLRVIEQKVFNEHRFWENLRLALIRVRRLEPTGVPAPPEEITESHVPGMFDPRDLEAQNPLE